MNFSLIICTYNRPDSLIRLLSSVNNQLRYPNEILIIDGSINFDTKSVLDQNSFTNLKYFQVGECYRGLTKQRNFGISKLDPDNEIVCFLDDDVVLTSSYFDNLINTYKEFPEAIGVGGYIIDEKIKWEEIRIENNISSSYYIYDGFYRKDSSRFLLRKKLGLLDHELSPTYMPEYGHGRSVGFLPPSGKTYEVETFMGGVSSFRKSVFEKLQFSEYFEGYGLYEDTDFTLRSSKIGKLYINTSAKLYHLHHFEGRPNQFTYGKMVIRNGWYVWRVKYPNPSFNNIIKWHLISFVLTLIRFTNIFNTSQKKEALTETLGRTIGWWSLFYNKPLKND
jgi:GT2 family glycosyltransferase